MKFRRNVAFTLSVLAIIWTVYILATDPFSTKSFSSVLEYLAWLLYPIFILTLLHYSRKSKYATALNWAAFILSIAPIVLMVIVFLLYVSNGGC